MASLVKSRVVLKTRENAMHELDEQGTIAIYPPHLRKHVWYNW